MPAPREPLRVGPAPGPEDPVAAGAREGLKGGGGGGARAARCDAPVLQPPGLAGSPSGTLHLLPIPVRGAAPRGLLPRLFSTPAGLQLRRPPLRE